MKQILLLTGALIIFIGSNAQKKIEDNGDSLQIHSLQQQLKTVNGVKEVDLLNAIAWEYMWYGSDKTPSYNFAALAKRKADSMGYEKGVGYASFLLAYKYVQSDKNTADSMFKVALTIGEKLDDSRLIGWCYYQQWDLKKALAYFVEAGDTDGEAETVTWLCNEYSSNSGQEGDFSYCQRAIELASVKKNTRLSYSKWISGFAYTTLSGLYNFVGDYRSALELIEEAKKYSSERDLYWSYASTYMHMGKDDSSLYYFEKALSTGQQRWNIIRHVGYANQRVGNFKRAAELLEESSKIFLAGEKNKRGSPTNWRGEIHSHLGEAYDSLGERNNAVKNYNYALEHSRQFYQQLVLTSKPGNKLYGNEAEKGIFLMNVSQQLSSVFSGLKEYDSSLFYLRQYIRLKDTIDNKKKAWQLNMQLSNFKRAAEEERRTSQLKLLQKNNQLTQAKLKQETILKNSLATGFLLLCLVGIFVFRTTNLKRKNERLLRVQLENEWTVRELESEQKQAKLQQKAAELEMQALRAQMNPHFIFNCLSSINRFVLKNETEAASDYLTRFSRLIRMVLINSQKPLIAIEDELEMLRIYIDMERLRFKHSFDYNITFSNSIDIGDVLVPPLILQPFCENAIWHGLMHKQGRGKLDINISMEKNILHCTITDNGIGRAKADELNSKSAESGKSFGLKITKERLMLLNEDKDIQTLFDIEDQWDEHGEAAGTKVSIRIKYKGEAKEFA